MREKHSDYFENSRKATLIQRDYAVRNPREYIGYGEDYWGFTACDGPAMARPPHPVQAGSFSVTLRGARHGGRMTGPSRRQRRLDRCPSSPRLPYPLFEIFVKRIRESLRTAGCRAD